MVRNLHMLLIIRRPYKEFPRHWTGILMDLEEFEPRVKILKVN